MANKLVTSRTLSASFPSPETPPCSEDDQSIDLPRGCSSERVPHSSYRSQRRYVAAAALMPFYSGRTLPSKWDDAERWISSPVSVGNISTSTYYGAGTAKSSHLAQSQRRAKSKSGPLGPAGQGMYGSYNTFSPVLGVGVLNGDMKWRNSLAIESPVLVQARLEERFGNCGGGASEGGRRSLPGHGTPEWLDLWSGHRSPRHNGEVNLTDESAESMKNSNSQDYNGEAGVDRVVSRRDMATQMFPESESMSPCYSAVSSPRSWISDDSPGPQLNEASINAQPPELEVKDVQVDKQISRTYRSSPGNKVSENPSDSITTDEDNKMSKLQAEEARIIAWENLQKAKAESAIQKLEMKLEKKRTSSMEKIKQKLRRAEVKAEKMRSSLSSDSNQIIQSRAILKTTFKIPSFCRKLRFTSSTRSCSTCYPF